MISLLFILISVLGIVFIALTYADEDELIWPVAGIFTWLIAAIGAFNIEWQVSVANTTGGITTSVVSYTAGWPLSLLFMFFAFVCVLFVWFRVLEKFRSVAR